LKDGRLNAEQIMNLTGQIPMPSLVFSNACQSGLTDEWRLREDFEHRIFGLANAFLLTGVQHYIGTFWEIPDEAGCNFAVTFYQNLVNGETIGEAMRLARQSLIDKYGEDTIVWASYMLYGDPTTRYVDLSQEEQKSLPHHKAKEDTVPPVDTGKREQVISVATEKKPIGIFVIAGLLLVLLAGIGGFFYLGNRDTERPVVNTIQAPAPVPLKEEKSQEKIDELVAFLATRYREGKFDVAGTGIKSGPVTMVIMDVKPAGAGGFDDRDNMVSQLTQVLQNGSTVQMVERELLDKLLEELKLSSSALADPATALKIGRILSARIIITGSIMAEGNRQTVILRLIDTETTAIRKVVSAETKTKIPDRETAKELGTQILDWAKTEYPQQVKS
jgi:hypothetical protein